MRADFGDPVAEHHAVRSSVGVADRSRRRILAASGPDAARFLHGLLSNDIENLKPGEGCYATILTERGNVVTDVVVLRRAADFILHTPPETGEAGFALLDRFLIGDDATLADRSEALGIVGVYGPRAGETAGAVLPPDLPPLSAWHFVEREFAGATVLVAAAGAWTGEDGFEILAPREALAPLWRALVAQARARGGRPVGETALETLRVEAGTPRAGVDFDAETLPQQANLDHALSFTKGCYRGQEIVLRVRTRGHANRKLVGLHLSGPPDHLPAKGAKITRDGTESGWITSAVLSPTLGRPIAIAAARRGAEAEGTRVEVHASPPREGTVVPLPFI
jgi:folate-binding protein YgfZ